MPKRIVIGKVLPLLIILVTGFAGSRAAFASSQAAAIDTAASIVSEDVLWDFGVSDTDAAGPTGGVIADKWGNLYGTTSRGGAYCAASGLCGTVFELSPPADYRSPWSEKILWSFGGSSDDGNTPFSNLIADAFGNLYGTTVAGGANFPNSGSGGGIVFELRPPFGKQKSWSETILWNFGAGEDGQLPATGVIADAAGNFYGTTTAGGEYGGGIAYKLSPPLGNQKKWSETILWNFGSAQDGATPTSSLIFDCAGNLYGTTEQGGAYTLGTAYKLTAPPPWQKYWKESVLWSFGLGTDGAIPFSPLLPDHWGNFYGTTAFGGSNQECELATDEGCGTVYELSPPIGNGKNWNETVLYNFSGAPSDGNEPVDGLIADAWGNLYGETETGGNATCVISNSCGTVFELSPPAGKYKQWTESILWSFATTGTTDGISPSGGLIADQWGNLLGTTIVGGVYGEGIVFKLSTP